MTSSMLRTAAILGLLSAVGPFAIDMYLPALPVIATDLGASVGATQGTIAAFFVAFGTAQLVYGPWADQSGRKAPLYAGLAIFVVATVGCALSGSIGTLTIWRFIQGLGAAAMMVVPRAIIRDLHTGHEATRLMALVMLVISVSPMLAPLAGSGLIAIGDWRLIFWALCGAAALSLWLISTMLPETLAHDQRVPVNARSLLSGAKVLLTDPVFMGLTFVGGFGMASFFVFIASASFVYTGQFGLSPTGFSIAFAINAIGFFAASQAAAPLGARFGPVRLVRVGVMVFAVFAILLLALAVSGHATLPIVIAGLFMANAGLGVVIPTTMVLALDHHGDIAGLASSLGGTMQMLAGGAMIAATGPFFDGTATPMLAGIALCAAASLLLAMILPLSQAASKPV